MKPFQYLVACLTSVLFLGACGPENEAVDSVDSLPGANADVGISEDALDSAIPPRNAGFDILGYVANGPIKTGYKLKNNTTGTCLANASGNALSTATCSTALNQLFTIYTIPGSSYYWLCKERTLAAVSNKDVCKSRLLIAGPPYACASTEKKDVLQATCFETNSWNSSFQPNGGAMKTVVLSTKPVGSTGAYTAREDKFYPTVLNNSGGKLNLRSATSRYFVSDNGSIRLSDSAVLTQQTWAVE